MKKNHIELNNFWNSFYLDSQHQNYEPSETLIRFIKSYDKKKIGTVLDLSAGNGRHTMWLRKQKIETISSEINNKILNNIKNKKEHKIILDLENQKTFKNIVKFNLKTIISVSTFYHVDSVHLKKFMQYVSKHCSVNYIFCNFISNQDEIFQKRDKVTLTNNKWIYTNNIKENRTADKLNLFSYSIKELKKIFVNFRKIYFFYESVPVNFHLRKAPNQKKLIWVLAVN